MGGLLSAVPLQLTKRTFVRWAPASVPANKLQAVRDVLQTEESQRCVEDFRFRLAYLKISNARPNSTGSMVLASVKVGQERAFTISLPPYEQLGSGGMRMPRTIPGLMEQIGIKLLEKAPFFEGFRQKIKDKFSPEKFVYIEPQMAATEFILAVIARISQIPASWDQNKAEFDEVIQSGILAKNQDSHIVASATGKFRSMATYALEHGASVERLHDILNECIVSVTMKQ